MFVRKTARRQLAREKDNYTTYHYGNFTQRRRNTVKKKEVFCEWIADLDINDSDRERVSDNVVLAMKANCGWLQAVGSLK